MPSFNTVSTTSCLLWYGWLYIHKFSPDFIMKFIHTVTVSVDQYSLSEKYLSVSKKAEHTLNSSEFYFLAYTNRTVHIRAPRGKYIHVNISHQSNKTLPFFCHCINVYHPNVHQQKGYICGVVLQWNAMQYRKRNITCMNMTASQIEC